MNEVLTADVVIVGGGPAGLSAARELRKAGVAEVLVLEREAEAGGIPRHSDHTGYGLRDIKRLMKGPAYARKLAARAHDSGAWVLTSATVTGWADGCSLLVTRPSGRMRVDAKAVILATGARERPRAARLVPGDRPAGVLTTGQLQTAIHAGQGVGGTRAVVVGSQLVSWSAVLTLREAGCATVLMTSEFPAAEVPALVRWGASRLLGGPLARRTRITRIIGRVRVEAVEVEDLRTG
ncbi:MAG: FAD-dependent oxidoreductase, partial [Actinobacteria bacterium]|nr:FAD-dependent oxidoreductase [Actinomycetota bacterium]